MTEHGDEVEADNATKHRWPVRRIAPYAIAVLVAALTVALVLAGRGLAGHDTPPEPLTAPVANSTAAGSPEPAPSTARPTPSRTASRTPTPAATRPPRTPTASPTPTLPAAPGAARTGRFTSPSGLCLDDNGATSADGNRIQVWGCNTTAAQVFTLATDGTLQVVGKCLRVAGTELAAGAAVELFTCAAGAPAQQWRLLPSGTLVLAAGAAGRWLCLANPGTSIIAGTRALVQSCGADPWHPTDTAVRWEFSG